MKALIVSFAVLLLVGCSSVPGMPGYISESISTYDDSTQYRMEPAFVYRSDSSLDGYAFSMGLYWSSKSPDSFLMEVRVNSWSAFITGESLFVNIDGEEKAFHSNAVDTDFEYDGPSKYASYDYLVKSSFLKRMLSGDSVKIKVITKDGYVDGLFTNDSHSSAINAFKDFVQKVEKHQS